jgi:UDPglucose 6-dehydrogenase
MKKISMIGCGKLGQDCAEVMAEHYDVLGYDTLPRNPKNFNMALNIKEAVLGRDIIFIAVPTPHSNEYGGETPTSHLPNKDFDYTIVKEVLKEVNQHANKNQLVVLISTVLPGTVRSELIDLIDNARFVYNPYLIAMGTVKWDMTNPEMVIIGTEDGSLTTDARELIDFYTPIMENNPRYEVGTWDEAESIKIFYNTFISAKLGLVNMIQDVAERNGNINVDVVTEALAKSTKRIMGPGYMKAGMGDGGACHPRDNIALRFLAEKLDLGYDLFDSIMLAREIQAKNIALKLLEYGKNVCIVGKAYKPAVPYTIGSSSMLVGHYVTENNGNLSYYDPNTNDTTFVNADVYLIGYWEDWVNDIKWPDGCTVIDPWRMLNSIDGVTVIHYGNTRKIK